VAAYDTDPLTLTLTAEVAAPAPQQPLLLGAAGGTPTIDNEVPTDGSAVTSPAQISVEVL
jgi:hypothetical protein